MADKNAEVAVEGNGGMKKTLSLWNFFTIGFGAIVGVGLPQVSPRQEMLRRYYDAQNGAGFDYAYRWPGMNKVLQTAGRVIRTQEDKGVVLLLDDRFAQSEYARLFPKHWRHLEYLRDTKELKKKLEDFWAE